MPVVTTAEKLAMNPMMGDVAALCWPHPDTCGILSECGQNQGLPIFEVVRHDDSQRLTGHDEVGRQPSQHFAV